MHDVLEGIEALPGRPLAAIRAHETAKQRAAYAQISNGKKRVVILMKHQAARGRGR